MIKRQNKQQDEESKTIKKFSNTKALKVTSQLYEFEKLRCRLSTHGYRLLYAIAQSVEYPQMDLFPEVGFDIKTVFEYMGLSKTNRDYELLKEALENISENPLKLKEKRKNGSFAWAGHAWITDYYLATDEPILYIRINERAKPFLSNIKQYALIRPKDYLKLNTDIQNWFYPFLKLKLGQRNTFALKLTIQELKEALFLDKTKSYNPKYNVNANINFFKRIIGIVKYNGTYQEGKDWEYTRDKGGNFNGTIAMISAHTDINVTAWAKKDGRSYTSVIFNISQKGKEQCNKVPQRDVNSPIKPRSEQKQFSEAKDLFSSIYEEMDNKLPLTVPQKVTRIKTYTKEELHTKAKEYKISFKQLIEKMRLKQRDENTYYKEY